MTNPLEQLAQQLSQGPPVELKTSPGFHRAVDVSLEAMEHLSEAYSKLKEMRRHLALFEHLAGVKDSCILDETFRLGTLMKETYEPRIEVLQQEHDDAFAIAEDIHHPADQVNK